MSKTCYNCGTQNADAETFCRQCGADLSSVSHLQNGGMQAGVPEERVLWEKGDIQLTSLAVLIGMQTDSPDVIPLDTIYEVVLEDRCVVLKVKDGDDKHCFHDDPTELATLVQEQMDRPRHAHDRKDSEYIPPE